MKKNNTHKKCAVNQPDKGNVIKKELKFKIFGERKVQRDLSVYCDFECLLFLKSTKMLFT
jgi:hypothetical protein